MNAVATVTRLHKVLPASREFAATWLEVDLCEVDLGETGLCMLHGGHTGSCLPIPDGYVPHTAADGFAEHLRESAKGALTTAGAIACVGAWYGLAAVMQAVR